MRLYKQGNKTYFSVTTILSELFPFEGVGKRYYEAWCLENGYDPDEILRTSQVLGERYHAYFENRYYGIADLADEVESSKDRAYQKVAEQFFNDGWEVVQSEVTIVNEQYGFAGRLDQVASLNGVAMLQDIKTWGAWKDLKYWKKMGSLKKEKVDKVKIQLSMYSKTLGLDHPVGLVYVTPVGYQVVELEPDDMWEERVTGAIESLREKLAKGLIQPQIVDLDEKESEE